MSKSILLYSGIMLLGNFISAISQVLLKISANREHGSKIKEYLNPFVIIAYVIFFFATLMSVLAYKVIPLSLGPVLEASGYIYVTIFGVVIFKERINKKKAFALLMIIIGIMIYGIYGI